ncbi:hypothetical protein TELCIR_20406, partial [Teladorsagia circumcincta]
KVRQERKGIELIHYFVQKAAEKPEKKLADSEGKGAVTVNEFITMCQTILTKPTNVQEIDITAHTE